MRQLKNRKAKVTQSQRVKSSAIGSYVMSYGKKDALDCYKVDINSIFSYHQQIVTMETFMPANLLDNLEKKYENLTAGKIKLDAYLDFILKSVKSCDSLDDVDTLMFYALRDDWVEGITVCDKIAEEALKLRAIKKIKGLERNDKEASVACEYITMAQAFAHFGKPNSKELFRKYFDKAISVADSYLDYEILAGSLAAACRNMEAPELDKDLSETRNLLEIAFKKAVEAKSSISLDALASIAEFDLSDKKLAKSIKDAKKKL